MCEKIAGKVPEPRRAAFRRLRDETGEVIDEALVLFFAGPNSETGEDCLELQAHGSPAVLQRLAALLGDFPGCRPAEPGEFAQRAFLNGKVDLTAVEGLADLVDAETEAQRRLAVRQMGGSLRDLYEGWRTRLVEILALAEAGIDFVDEGDVGGDIGHTIAPILEELRREIEAHLSDARRGERIRHGAVVTLAGSPNVGKSSLMNALARREVAIVTDVPGTTRDRLEVRLDLDGMAVTVIDTAGLRETADVVEREGVRRARLAIKEADLVLLLGAGGPPISTHDGEVETWRVESKVDLTGSLPGRRDDGTFGISVKTGDGVADLLDALAERFRHDVASSGDVLLTQARHRRHLSECVDALAAAVRIGYDGEPDLFAEELRRAARSLGRITGRVDVEEVLGAIFERLCIGK
ncbi:GTPase and tRNA-U34 5-formylation enzyme TrmE [Lutibaculum baratangense AMV1]|uniref:tRNA modification GTPase MnmE n=1 Tax=Lutibaculum baratangense AMV1 TaxID=631454 RepID=V4RL83_9HYPH|nr:GTPase and tRNA-U34 5-formylation enzyme TrmE [Lutibaculum baratangense AMV1]